jgi:hypothetical protein
LHRYETHTCSGDESRNLIMDCDQHRTYLTNLVLFQAFVWFEFSAAVLLEVIQKRIYGET